MINDKTKQKKTNTNIINHIRSSCTFSVYDGWARLIVFFLLDPHLFKCRQRRQDGTSNPDRVLSLWWSNNLNRHRVWCQSLNLFLHSLWNSIVHGGTSRHHNVAVQVLSDIHIALHNRRECQLVNSLLFQTNKLRLEQHFWCSKSLSSDSNNLTIRQFVILLQFRRSLRFLHFFV